MNRLAFFGGLLGCIVVVACVGDNPDPATNPTNGDGGTSSSGGQSGPNLAEEGGFENGCPSSTSSAEITVETVGAKSGGKACKVCSKGTETGYILELRVGIEAKKGEVYRVGAFMRKAPGVEPGGGSPLVSVIALESDTSPVVPTEGGFGGNIVLTDTGYKEGFGIWNVGRDVSLARIDIGLDNAVAGQCFLVDDVTLVKQN